MQLAPNLARGLIIWERCEARLSIVPCYCIFKVSAQFEIWIGHALHLLAHKVLNFVHWSSGYFVPPPAKTWWYATHFFCFRWIAMLRGWLGLRKPVGHALRIRLYPTHRHGLIHCLAATGQYSAVLLRRGNFAGGNSSVILW